MIHNPPKPRARVVSLASTRFWKVVGTIHSPTGTAVTITSNLRPTLPQAWESFEKVIAYYAKLWG